MSEDHGSEGPAPRRISQVQVGLVLTTLWLGAGLLYVAATMAGPGS